jgi:hypothetical protein
MSEKVSFFPVNFFVCRKRLIFPILRANLVPLAVWRSGRGIGVLRRVVPPSHADPRGREDRRRAVRPIDLEHAEKDRFQLWGNFKGLKANLKWILVQLYI